MQTKRIRTLHIIIVFLVILTMISLTCAGTMGILYVREAGEADRLRGEKEQLLADQAMPVLSVDVEDNTAGNGETGMTEQDAESASEIAAAGQDSIGDADAADIAALMQAKESEVEQSIKDRMKALVTGEDGLSLIHI